MLQIKKLPVERWEEFKELRLIALQKDPLAFGSSYEEEIKFQDDLWKNRLSNTLFAVYDDKPVGMVLFLIDTKLKLSHVAEIFGVYVREEFRDRKIGKQLIESLINSIRKNKSIIKIKLTVTDVQESAIKLYSSFGFKVVGRHEKELKYGDNYYDGIIMEKML
jgi:ribosomal protein S18 acetylase RimI-like enzyme